MRCELADDECLHRPPDDASGLVRSLSSRPGVGIAARDVRQGQRLEILRARVELPALILVDRGVKAIKASGRTVRGRRGQAIVLGGQPDRGLHQLGRGRARLRGTMDAVRQRFDRRFQLRGTGRRGRIAGSESRHGSAPGTGAEQPGRRLRGRHAGAGCANHRSRRHRATALEAMHWLLEAGVVLNQLGPRPPDHGRPRASTADRPPRYRLDGGAHGQRTRNVPGHAAAPPRRRRCHVHGCGGRCSHVVGTDAAAGYGPAGGRHRAIGWRMS